MSLPWLKPSTNLNCHQEKVWTPESGYKVVCVLTPPYMQAHLWPPLFHISNQISFRHLDESTPAQVIPSGYKIFHLSLYLDDWQAPIHQVGTLEIFPLPQSHATSCSSLLKCHLFRQPSPHQQCTCQNLMDDTLIYLRCLCSFQNCPPHHIRHF